MQTPVCAFRGKRLDGGSDAEPDSEAVKFVFMDRTLHLCNVSASDSLSFRIANLVSTVLGLLRLLLFSSSSFFFSVCFSSSRSLSMRS